MSESINLPIVVELTEPIEQKNPSGEVVNTIESFEIARRPKAKDFKGISTNNMRFDDVCKLISRVCNQPLKVVEELDAGDFMTLQKEINAFLPDHGE